MSLSSLFKISTITTTVQICPFSDELVIYALIFVQVILQDVKLYFERILEMCFGGFLAIHLLIPEICVCVWHMLRTIHLLGFTRGM